MRWLLLAVLLGGCEVDSAPYDLHNSGNFPHDRWDHCAATVGAAGNRADFARCLQGVTVTVDDAGTSD
jgi:hypothetical protein